VFLGFYCNFVKSGPIVTKFGKHGATDNINHVANLVTVWFLLLVWFNISFSAQCYYMYSCVWLIQIRSWTTVLSVTYSRRSL